MLTDVDLFSGDVVSDFNCCVWAGLTLLVKWLRVEFRRHSFVTRWQRHPTPDI